MADVPAAAAAAAAAAAVSVLLMPACATDALVAAVAKVTIHCIRKQVGTETAYRADSGRGLHVGPARSELFSPCLPPHIRSSLPTGMIVTVSAAPAAPADAPLLPLLLPLMLPLMLPLLYPLMSMLPPIPLLCRCPSCFPCLFMTIPAVIPSPLLLLLLPLLLPWLLLLPSCCLFQLLLPLFLGVCCCPC